MTWAFAERRGEKSSSFVAAAEREIVPARIAEKIENAFIRAPDLILNLVVQRNWRKRKWGAVGARGARDQPVPSWPLEGVWENVFQRLAAPECLDRAS
jgi:hypothetical protein